MLKSQAYSRVSEIGDKYGIDVSDKLVKLALNEIVPSDVLNFIAEYDQKDGSEPTNQLSDEFKETIKTKKLYDSLYSDDYNERAKAVSSFITHVLIDFKVHPDYSDELRKSIDFDLIFDGLLYYTTESDHQAITTVSNYIKDLLNS